MRAEFVATRALALCAAENLDDALREVASVRGLSSSSDAVFLVEAVDTVVRVKRHDSDAVSRVIELIETAFRLGALDHLITTYRGVPEMLAIMLKSQSAPFSDLVRRVHDDDLANRVGFSVSQVGPAKPDLTAREREIHALLREGLTNREIAALLFIAEPTVKLHVQHIFDKVGVRSRKAIAMQAALERTSQATSAIDETGEDSDS
jgi:DNA-binding NarL/FixJ family response regulator